MSPLPALLQGFSESSTALGNRRYARQDLSARAELWDLLMHHAPIHLFARILSGDVYEVMIPHRASCMLSGCHLGSAW